MASSPTSANSSYIIQNCLLFAYKCLRSSERLVKDSIQSPYEKFYDDLAKKLCMGKKLEYAIPNSEVEAFYTKRVTEKEFIASVHSRILHAIGTGSVVSPASTPTAPTQCNIPGGTSTSINTFNHFSVVYALVWEMLSKQYSSVCSKLPLVSGRQLWEVFLKLDRG